MTNEEKAKELFPYYEDMEDVEIVQVTFERKGALKMAGWKDSQPQIIEIFGKRVKIVEDDSSSAKICITCALSFECLKGHLGICRNADDKFNRHFVEVDKDGNEIG